MSQLIKSRKEVTTAPRSIPLPPTATTTAPVEMDPKPANSLDPVDPIGPQVSQVPTSSASSVALHASATRHDIGIHYLCLRVITSKEKYPGTLSPVEDGDPMNVSRSDTPMTKQHSALARRRCAHSCRSLLRRVTRKGLRIGKIIKCGSAVIFRSLAMWGSKFPEIDVFSDVYVRFGDELAESLHISDDDGEGAVGSLQVRLPTSFRDSTRVCGSPRRCGVSNPYRDIGSYSRTEVGDVL
ncbi:hypothetical protein C1H46_021674 [Malus baccata]|uniref:Uncharacterized protein n=1 Tax=Malus baccata TaxID=106549 RepID=A0A540M1S4_MALBA|nr:hypothetical protein C1H46_021674 [Malus baccata]